MDLFQPSSPQEDAKTSHLMSVLDQINHRFGSHTLKLAAEGYSKPWQ